MKKIKLVFSILAIVLSLSMSGLTVFATETTLATAPSTLGDNYATTESTTPIGGQYGMVSNKQFKWRSDASKPNNYFGFQYQDQTNDTGYIVWEGDWYLGAAEPVAVGVWSAGTSEKTVATNGWILNRWNRVKVVYGCSDGSTQIYINGVKAADAKAKISAGDFRIYLKHIASTDSNKGTLADVYVKDYSCYYTDDTATVPGANTMPAITTVDGNFFKDKIELNEGVKLDSIAVTDGAEKRAYTDGTFATAVAADAELTTGNVIVVEQNKALKYYEVVDELKYAHVTETPAWTSSTITENGTVKGADGQTDVKQYKINDSITAASLQSTFDDSEYMRYVVFEYNIKIDDTSVVKPLNLSTGGGVITTSQNSGLKNGTWHRVMMVVDTEGTTTGANRVYVDGKLSINTAQGGAGQFLSENNENKRIYRISFNNIDATGSIRTFAIDNFQIYSMPSMPNGGSVDPSAAETYTINSWTPNNATGDETVSGLAGKSGAVNKYVFEDGVQAANISYTFPSDQTTYRYVTIKYDMYVNETNRTPIFTVNSAHNDSVAWESGMREGIWHDIVVVVDRETKQRKVYADGVMCADWVIATEGEELFMCVPTHNELRLRVDLGVGNNSGEDDVWFAVDNIEVSSSATEPTYEKDYKNLAESVNLVGNKLYVNSNQSFGDLAEKYTAEGAETVVYDPGNTLSDSTKLVLKTDESTLKTYDVVPVAEDTKIISYEGGVFTFVNSGTLIIAKYDANGNLINAEVLDKTQADSDSMVSKDGLTLNDDIKKINAYLWNMHTLKPIDIYKP